MKSLTKASLVNNAFQVIQHMNSGMTVVEEYLSKAVTTSWMAERMPGGESLILKEGWGFGEGGGRFHTA